MGERKLGEIVAVQGGHIVRSTGRKDRHSKVCTAKGPRDRRVRLAAHTAIQFYDVQDRLGYDRPSKAVDWLITKAKSAIDELEKLPPWNPIEVEQGRKQHQRRREAEIPPPAPASEPDSIKFVFPVDGEAVSDFDFRGGGYGSSRDLKLSLQFQNPMLLQNHHQFLLSPVGFDTATNNNNTTAAAAVAVAEHEVRFQNLPASDCCYFNSAGNGIEQQQLLFSSQRGTLQSSTPSIRAWMDPISSSMATADHLYQGFLPNHPPSLIPGFQFPAPIQGHEHHNEIDDGFFHNKPSSVSSSNFHPPPLTG